MSLEPRYIAVVRFSQQARTSVKDSVLLSLCLKMQMLKAKKSEVVFLPFLELHTDFKNQPFPSFPPWMIESSKRITERK